MSNARLSADGHGSRVVSLSRVVHGVSIMPNGEDTVRDGRVLYTKLVTSDSFSVTLNFNSHARYESLAKWLKEYGESIADADRGTNPMRIEVPDVDFDRFGVVTRGIAFGDTTRSFVYSMTLSFEGVRDMVSLSGQKLSRYKLPVELGEATGSGLYHSPNDLQISVAQIAEERLYGMSEEDAKNMVNRGAWSPILLLEDDLL